MRRYLVAGNWKMNGSRQANAALVERTAAGVAQCRDVEVLVCPPAGPRADAAVPFASGRPSSRPPLNPHA